MSEQSSKPVITLSNRADDRIASILDDEGYDPSTAGLRVAVERGGCAGLSYRFGLAASPAEDDVVDNRHGVRVFVDPAAVAYVEGTDIDVTQSAHGKGFKVENPNAEEQCGCGLSFR
ncbi:HesB/IscA family protein [Halolamina salifodinae]|uniref:Iron-sulfur cluster assembly accessory protein n=1 Tax=Halolamina salifodinae TaxID=1202767 RepID=A0A8T4GY93_9EURY|nr:iron-sulfur cluster assembly accessory protein [Halolamina salifodinae]MBP1987093.1 iron-sulfur cluster assembly accessory protein [Halolamina salifodinae]